MFVNKNIFEISLYLKIIKNTLCDAFMSEQQIFHIHLYTLYIRLWYKLFIVPSWELNI